MRRASEFPDFMPCIGIPTDLLQLRMNFCLWLYENYPGLSFGFDTYCSEEFRTIHATSAQVYDGGVRIVIVKLPPCLVNCESVNDLPQHTRVVKP